MIAQLANSEALRPHSAQARGVLLQQKGPVITGGGNIESRSTGRVYPNLAPGFQINGCFPVQDTDQPGPRSITVCVSSQVFLQALAEACLADNKLKLAHHDRRLVINNVAVHLPRLREVGQVLPNGIGPNSAVYRIRAGVVGYQKTKRVVYPGKQRVHDLGRHEVGKYFLGPNIVKPRHGNQVTKPHVRCFVRDKRPSVEQFGVGRIFFQQQVICAVKDRTHMLHTAVLKTGHKRKIELLEGVVYIRVALQPGQRAGVLFKYCLYIARYFVWISFSVQHGHGTAINRAGNGLEFAGRKCKKVGTNGVGSGEFIATLVTLFSHRCHRCIAQCYPTGGHIKSQVVTRLEVWLVKQGESRAGPVWHKQGVEIVRITI